MKEIGLEELKELQLDILQKVHQFCCANNIRYSLAAGTLLGAIRHKGYIPWDDDIDILMPRPDYEKFLGIFNGSYPELEVLAPELDWNYYAPYANICNKRTILKEGALNHRNKELGVKIDVFPIDGVPDDPEDYKLYDSKMKRSLQKISYKKWTIRDFKKAWRDNKKGFLILILNYSLICFTKFAKLQKKHHDLAVRYPFEHSKYADNTVFNTSQNLKRVERSYFENYITVPFENYTFFVLKEYDSYLRVIYGDYMQMPPEDQRIPHHDFYACWK